MQICVISKKRVTFAPKKFIVMNPFSYGTIVKGDHFYDRKDECTRIVNTLSDTIANQV